MRLPPIHPMVVTFAAAAAVVAGVVLLWPKPPRPVPAAQAPPPRPPAPDPPLPAPRPDPIRARLEQEHTATVKEWAEKVAAAPHRFAPDADRAAAVRKAHADWGRAGTVGVFDRSPAKDAAGADLGRTALDTRVRFLVAEHMRGDGPVDLLNTSRVHLERAVRAGCDDPLVRYWHMRATAPAWPPADPAGAKAVIARVCDSGYAPVWRAHAALNWVIAAGTLPPADPLRADTAAWEDRFWELFAAAAREQTTPADEAAIDLCARWEGYRRGQGDPRERVLDELDRQLAAAGARDYLRLTVRGRGLVALGSDARGTGFADTVPAAAWRVFEARFRAARDALSAAAEDGPDGYTAPTTMMSVCLGLSLNREEMEATFRRAVAANPDNRAAVLIKLDYLHPKWHGRPDGADYFTFAWDVALHPAAGPLAVAPLTSLDRNYRVSRQKDVQRLNQLRDHYSHPAVWSLARLSAERAAAADPADTFARSLFAKIAVTTRRYDYAEEQFELIGERFHPAVFENLEDYTNARLEAGAWVP